MSDLGPITRKVPLLTAGGFSHQPRGFGARRNWFSWMHLSRAPWHHNEKHCRSVSMALGRHLQGKHHFSSLFKGLSLLFLPYPHKAKVRLVLKKKHLIPSRRLSAKGTGCKSPLFPRAAVGFMFWVEEINLLPTHNREHL